MNQHYLIGPDNEKHRICSSPNSTIVGSNPTRKYNLLRKLILPGELAENHCIIKPFTKSALIKPLTPGGIKLNGTLVKFETAAAINDRDELQIGNVVYFYFIQIEKSKAKKFKPVVDSERYLKTLKKNSNYKPVHVNFRK